MVLTLVAISCDVSILLPASTTNPTPYPGAVDTIATVSTNSAAAELKAGKSMEDIVAEFGPAGMGTAAPEPPVETRHHLTEEEAEVFRAIGPYPLHIDELVRKLARDAGALSGILLQLELKGLVTQQPGKRFSAADREVDT